MRLWTPSHPPASERLSEIRARTLIIEGENDNPDYKAMADQLFGIAGAKKVVMAGAAHAINLDKPEEFSDVVLEFLNAK